jgi:hypothetical protein
MVQRQWLSDPGTKICLSDTRKTKKMSSQIEEWYFVEDGKLYRHTENDGYQFMKRGAQARDTFLMTVEEAKVKCPGRLAEAYGE